jgi:hypothetical protein
MKRQDLFILVSVAAIAAVFSIVLASALFAPKKLSQKVPVVDKISETFPDVTHDPAYTSFLNSQALDLIQPVQIGPHNQNQQPFNQTQH